MVRQEDPGEGNEHTTLVALFDDQIDAEQALDALRKGDEEALRVSLVVRADPSGSRSEGPADLARAVLNSALDTVGTWLAGLAELVVPNGGDFLVAGPIGAALVAAGLPTEPAPPPAPRSVTAPQDSGEELLFRVLSDFGFADDEASYLQHRLEAGATLIAVTDDARERLQTARHLFADHDAVYIGLSRTSPGVLRVTERLLTQPLPLRQEGEVVIADAVAPLRSASDDNAPPSFAQFRGRDVVDLDGAVCGEVDDVLWESRPQHAGEVTVGTPRYLIVGSGGVFGIGRRRIAVPFGIVNEREDGSVRVGVDRHALASAPAFEPQPFSRRDEQQVLQHFGIEPYWQVG